MPLAAFIIVTMGVLVTAMARMGSQSSMSVVQEQVSLQAFYVAESGAQLAMSRLLYPEVDRDLAEAACINVNNSTAPLSAPGMNNCRVSLQCVFPAPNEIGVVEITSTGECGEGSVFARRSVEVGVWVE